MTKKEMSFMTKVKKNPWMISTAVLAILVVIMSVTGFVSVGNTVSANNAGESFVKFYNGVSPTKIEFVSAKSYSSDLYEVTVSVQGQEAPVYITKDGQYFVQIVAPLNEEEEVSPQEQETQEVVKSDKPEVELFIWSYCPYGVMAQEPLAEVASLLSEYADFKAVMYYDGHGPYETQQNKIQACIQKNEPDKYWEYASGFVETIYPNCGTSRDIECDKTESIKLMDSIGIDSNSVMSCVDTIGADLIGEDSDYARSLGVTGSPTLVINGVKVNVARDAESFKDAVCQAFNNAPESCGTELSGSSASTPAGNC